MISERQLGHLLAVAEHGHFGRAAKALDISQPALSKSVQGLEAQLGVKLLDRKPKGIALTVFGDLVVRRSNELITAKEDLRREIDQLAGMEIGTVKVALGPYPSVICGYPAVARMLGMYPKINMVVHAASWRDVANQVADGAIDIGIADLRNLQDDARFTTELIAQHRGRFFCRPGHPILLRESVSMASLFEFPWIAARLPFRMAAELPRPLGAAGTMDLTNGDFVPAIEIDVPMRLAELLAGSNAVTPAILTMMEEDMRSGKVVLVPERESQLRTAYGFICLKNRSLPPAALAFMKVVRSVEAEIVERERVAESHYR
jgi:DNA-binding transcriptional LysR family regulator